MADNEEGIEATVAKVVLREKGSYVVTYPRKSGLIPDKKTITFSLSCWNDSVLPEKGQVVLLFNLREYQKGWRAHRACPKKLAGRRNE